MLVTTSMRGHKNYLSVQHTATDTEPRMPGTEVHVNGETPSSLLAFRSDQRY